MEVERIIQAERPDLHETLYSNFPYKRHTVDGGNPNPLLHATDFSRCQGFFACAYLRVLIDRADHDPDCPKLSDQQREAINFLDEVCERPQLQERMMLERGQMLFSIIGQPFTVELRSMIMRRSSKKTFFANLAFSIQ